MKETYTYLITELVKRKVGIINLGRRGASAGSGEFFGHLVRPEGYPLPRGYDPVLDFGKLVKFPGSPTLLMANQDYTVEAADALVGAGKLDMITFARAFIHNPVSSPRPTYSNSDWLKRILSLVSFTEYLSPRTIEALGFIMG
jgi:2,4-dienoyl-CoA reductase-like NADH-dependent reductase (Old Yellow Enzyme family)